MKNLKIFTNNIEATAKEQIDLLMNQDAFMDAKVRIMPDVHAGAGCVIGFTADLGDKVIPNIVGVDIGCGVLCVSLGKIKIDLKSLDSFIKDNIPAGRNVSDYKHPYAIKLINELRCKNKLSNNDWLYKSLGTLGGGNHFIEVDVDEDGNQYLVIHTGSRNLGKQVADIYQTKAIEKLCTAPKVAISEIVTKLKNEGRVDEINLAIKEYKERFNDNSIPKSLCYLIDDDRLDYLHDMRLCQEFAQVNRKEIATQILNYLFNTTKVLIDENKMIWEDYQKESRSDCIFYFESTHNYIDDTNMIRKGAIASHKNQKVIIPLNMCDGAIIGIGKGNEDWNESAPHGAGRLMSRAEARRTLSLDDFKSTMNKVYSSTVDESTIDEAPMAYKNAQEIVDGIKDTVEITKIIKPIYNFKASEE